MILIVNKKASHTIKTTLKNMGHNVVDSMEYPGFHDATATHPDMQIHVLKHDLAICAPSCYTFYRERLPESIKLIKGDKEITGTYPNDCAYNVAKVGNFIFCNTNCASPQLLNYYKEENMQIIHVNQGYTKCNMAIIGVNTVITEDIGIHNTIMENRIPIKSILIPKGEVSLCGFPYGFIGGACGGNEKMILWYGNPEICSYNILLKDAMKGKVESITLAKRPLEDQGGIICFTA